ncbi:N-acetylglutamate synthase [Xylaria bambusicola]|uniref:N-acetylglutamate synthase n=1 Tax=Xylaria bambusicola TaxID=326684 RepID=UPI0020085226|nr:N-acetylglutamate synthase [Xylaria bambusicola]KAI0520805.1 N-acetylglutamate synthase [Xylaria bambusicola]
MILRHTTCRKAAAGWNTPLLKHSTHTKSDELSHGAAGGRGSSTLTSRPARPASSGGTAPPFVSPYASISEAQKLKKTQERDFLVTVLETSVTKRDAKAYMNRFVPFLERKSTIAFKQRTAAQVKSDGRKAVSDPSAIVAGNVAASEGQSVNSRASPKSDQDLTIQEPLFVALVKFRVPETVNDTTLDGVAKTLGRLRKLGLVSVVVVDSNGEGLDEITQRQTATTQARRIATAIDNYDAPCARVIDSPITIAKKDGTPASHFTSQDLSIGNSSELMTALQDDLIAIIPSYGYTADTCIRKPVDVNDAILALTRQLSGLQFVQALDDESPVTKVLRSAEVYRIIILEPLGGIPAKNRATGRHMFLNLEHEFQEVQADLEAPVSLAMSGESTDRAHHLENAKLARDALSLLPPTSSAIITTPQEAAKERRPEETVMDLALVGTRRGQNPLIHSLLTDKPVQSSSLPTERFTPITSSTGASQIGSLTTLAKRGMPLTIFPNPKITPWKPPQPGQSSLSLTDPCIDLPRLVNLIEDSFGRKLDVEHYLKRVEGNLAGIIIAGEYEGGAILTWEIPPGTTDLSRRVPYLDKFAVLRKSQGAGGVADIVFNAMVRNCFPEGVCWRSRKDNPVNKWYFERSRGTLKLNGMNWTMFWTTPKLTLHDQRFDDYEAVCRGIEPSWADKKHIVD